MTFKCSDCGEDIPSHPSYLINEHRETCGFEAKLKSVGLRMMSTKEACGNDIHPMRHWDEKDVQRCSFCEKEIDESKDCCY